MERKEFINLLAYSSIGFISLSMFLKGCSGTKYINVTANNYTLNIPIYHFEHSKENKVSFRRSIIVKPDISNYPVIIYRNSENDYSAFLLRCTHQGYELSVHGELITCSAHGSEFNNKGDVLNGPAERPLIQFPVNIHENELIIKMA